MGSAPESSAKETAQREEPAAEASAPVSGVASLVRALAEGRQKPKAKEQEVLDVATAYFLKHGYQGASINAMARSSGISKESIYRYFSSKKQLFEAVIGRELVDYAEKLRQLDPAIKTMDLRTALLTIAETVLAVLTTDRTLALRRLIFEEATRSPDVGHHYYKIGPERAYAVLEHVFEAHARKSRLPARMLARYFVAMMSYCTVLERECSVKPAPTKLENRQLAETVVDDFLAAFLPSR